MGSNDKQELIIMLLIENRVLSDSPRDEFYEFLNKNYNLEAFNKRYMELLVKFLNEYALDNTEKSEENL